MYNLTVDTAHTFFVGDGQWLVHNVDPFCWYRNKPNHPAPPGVYRFQDRTANDLIYIGESGDLRGSLEKHHRKNRFTDWDDAEWMHIPHIPGYDDTFVRRVAERALMFQNSGGSSINLANRKWPLNSPSDFSALREFFRSLPDNWPQELIPTDPKFFRSLK